RHDKSDYVRDDNLYYARNDKKQDGHETKASRHDKSDYVRDDNLYYARNDKKQDGHEAKASRDDNLLLAGKGHFKKTF
ncbi:MAG: hypothetical protein UHC59_03755, partial [Fibrobacteraceae bacterium]|nr:hypothetical protein [Fibrobacteraceae bacterium]